MPRRAASILVPLLLAALLAGCGQPAAKPGAGDGAAAEAADAPLHGAVFDPALRPLAGARLRLTGDGTDENATSDAQGLYAFAQAPRGRVLVLTASLDGFVAASRQATLPDVGATRLDVTLQPVPTSSSYVDVLKFDGLIACQAAVVVSEQVEQVADCGAELSEAEGAAVWDLQASSALASAIVEVVWEPTTPLADGLQGVLVHPDGAGGGAVLAEKVARSPLRLVVPQSTAAKLFADGGALRLTMSAMPITDEDEQAAAAGVVVQQRFQAFASLFYGAPPEPTYSFVNGTAPA